jgi:hypothetical protein
MASLDVELEKWLVKHRDGLPLYEQLDVQRVIDLLARSSKSPPFTPDQARPRSLGEFHAHWHSWEKRLRGKSANNWLRSWVEADGF